MSGEHTDIVFIEGLRIAGKHGVLSHERRIEQEFVLDIVATFDARVSAMSDKLSDTVDYQRFKEIAEKVIGGPHTYLIERIATRVADEILKDRRISKVCVTVRKPAVIPHGVVGVRIERKGRPR